MYKKAIKNKWFEWSGVYNAENGSPQLNKSILSKYNLQRVNGPQSKICYAPFRNLYFGYGGKASSCCYNRAFVLGEFPKQSIKEIWQGTKTKELQKYISENNLDNGCQGCLSQLLAHNFDAVKSKQYDEYHPYNQNFPSVLELELSNVCNLECQMCDGNHSSLIRKNRENLPPLQQFYDDSFVDQLEAFLPHLEEIKFYGGEPFLIDIYYKIWDKVVEINPNIRLSVQTNGTILNNRVKDLLSKSNFHINLSIDSLEAKTYNNIRANANFERVMENLHWFYQYCKEKNTYFGISMCAMKENWHEVPNFVDFANQLQIPLSIHTVTTPKQMAIRSLSLADLEKVNTVYKGYQSVATTSIEKKNKLHFEDYNKQLERWIALKSNLIVNEALKNSGSWSSFIQILSNEIQHSTKILLEEKAALQNKMAELFSNGNNIDLDTFKKAIDFNQEFLIDEMLGRIANQPLDVLKKEMQAIG